MLCILKTIVRNAFASITSSYGNLTVEKRLDIELDVFKKTAFTDLKFLLIFLYLSSIIRYQYYSTYRHVTHQPIFLLNQTQICISKFKPNEINSEYF